MKTCPACHLVYEDRFIFCTRDGTILDSNTKVNGSSTRRATKDSNSIAPDSLDSPVTAHKVMRCPVCAMEFPLTFTSCPSDGMRLVEKKPQPRVVASQISPAVSEEIVTEELSSTTTSQVESVPEPVITDELEESLPESEVVIYPSEPEPEPPVLIEPVPEAEASNSFEDYYSEPERRYVTAPLAGESKDDEPRSLKLAAKAVVAGLALIAVFALYFVYNAASQKPVAATTPQQEAYVEQPRVFIPTPEEARNYKDESEEAPSDEVIPNEEQNRDEATDRQIAKNIPSASEDSNTRRKPAVEPAARESVPVTKSEVRAAREVDTGPVIPQSTEGRISSRLVRVRSSKIGAGVRYDLTFSLEEQTGRTVRWDRMLVSTRSSRGINQTQTLPFYHRQGADGSLTFTVSVEMKGGSDADWRGRVVCTTLGTDERGRAMQARFGASVSP